LFNRRPVIFETRLAILRTMIWSARCRLALRCRRPAVIRFSSSFP
jgi:hypothetical protein